MTAAAPLLSALALALAAPTPALKPRLPALAAVFPQGAEPGRTLRVEVFGEWLDRAQAVVFLDPSIRGRVVESTYTRLTLELDIDSQSFFGPHYFRIVSPRGASNLLLFRVGDQPHVLEREPNSTIEDAQPVTLPVTINGRLNVDGDFDFFRFHAEKGQTWIFDLRSSRNGNGLDAALILLDSRRELAHSEDVFIWDPFLVYTFAESGYYYAVVQPTHARLDPTFAYQLDIRTAPHLETIAPLSLAPGGDTEATLYGTGLLETGARLWFDAPGFSGEVLALRGDTARVRIRCPAGAPPGPRQLALITAGGRSDPATFLVDDTPVHPGGEHILPPVSITGIARYRQPERFWFDVREKQTLVFEVRAHRFGSPVDSILRILDEKGNQLAVNDDAAIPGVQFNKDSYLSHTFAKPGRYQVEIRNLWKTTGEDFPYQLRVRPPHPDFDLMMAADNPDNVLKLTVVRREGFGDAIPFVVEGLTAPIRGEIPAGKDSAEVQLPEGARGQIRVTSGARRAWRSVRIASGGGEGATFATVDQATVAPGEKPLFALEADSTNLNLVRGGFVELNVHIGRAADFHDPLRFSFENLPPGVTASQLTADADAERATIRLSAAGDAPRGRYPRVAVLGAGGGQVQEAPKIVVNVD